ncbi:MAG: hypothetical protein JXB19_03195 [Bacteroidales bacterium]|nr:hypothetical protein [Bacteroidales bacterium]
MRIKAIITGSTGMIGRGVLLECLNSDDVGSVLVINRHSIGLTHSKLKEVILTDFSDLSAIGHEMTGYNTCFFCLGITSAGLPEKEYHRITYDLIVRFASGVLELNPGLIFCYISGAGTDETEKSRMMWARVKGKTENALSSMGFRAAYMFRPGFIIPKGKLRSRTPLYNSVYKVMKPFYPVLKKFSRHVTDTDKLAKAMIQVVLEGYRKNILENADINLIAEKITPTEADAPGGKP